MSRYLIAIFLLLPALAMSTPTASPGPDIPTFEEQFNDIRSESSNPVVLGVIQDNVVTDAEVQVLLDGFLGCMATEGYPNVQAIPDELIPGSYQYAYQWESLAGSPSSTSGSQEEHIHAYDTAFTACIREWGPAMGVRDAMFVNPDNENIFVLNLQCLHRYHLVPDSFGYAEIEHAANTGDWGPGVDPHTMEVTRCLVNPLEHGLEPLPVSTGTPAD